MNFSDALGKLKVLSPMTRSSWADQYITCDPDNAQPFTARQASDNVVIGTFTPSVEDIMAEDWENHS